MMADLFYFINYPSFLFTVREAFLTALRIFLSVFSGGEKCLCCGKKTLLIPLCKKCFTLKFYSCDKVNRCITCGKPLVSEIELCSSCRKDSVIKSCFCVHPLFTYRLWKKSLLFSWKMLDSRSLSPYFARLIYFFLLEQKENLPENPVIVPVPPRPGKIKEKGWDQIQELCFYLNRGYGIKVLRLLRRLSHTQQKKLDRTQRLEGIGSSYELVAGRKLKLITVPDTVILLDDVITTGSTIENCAVLLKKAGVKNVFALSLFIVD